MTKSQPTSGKILLRLFKRSWRWFMQSHSIASTQLQIQSKRQSTIATSH